MHKQLCFSHGHKFREWGYLGITPMVMVERMIDVGGEKVPEDYKFFVYHGLVHFIQVDYDR
jgi:TupA-like ATPgrasp